LLISDQQVTGGVLSITAAAWTAGFQWWRSGDITRTQNVREYMLYAWFIYSRQVEQPRSHDVQPHRRSPLSSQRHNVCQDSQYSGPLSESVVPRNNVAECSTLSRKARRQSQSTQHLIRDCHAAHHEIFVHKLFRPHALFCNLLQQLLRRNFWIRTKISSATF